MARITEFRKYNTFFSLMKETKKYKELYSEHCAWIACILTFIFSLILIYFYNIDSKKFFDIIPNILLTFSSGLLGLLGVYITGLALMVSIISQKTLQFLDKEDKVHTLVGILYCFYFAGAMIMATIIDFMLCYFLIFTGYQVHDLIIYLFIVISCFLFLFSIAYTVALLGTCINIYFANINIEREK